MLLSGETFDTAAALRYGLCYDVVAASALKERVNRLVEAIRQGAPEAIARTKDFLQRCRSTRLADQLEQAIVVSAAARETESAREGLQAFLEKRRPSWSA
jgi:methylglutaconyl-CoA hydratase